MRRFIAAALTFFLILLILVSSLYLWIRQDVQNNIEIVERIYHAEGEEALLLFLEDENNSPIDRTHLAIWTLGKLRSKKALPVLKDYYCNDKEGLSCKGIHHNKLCQYELYKAIMTIENGSILSYANLK